MRRQVALDTETTGLELKDDHRIIEVAAVAMTNRKIIDSFHTYINPQRLIDKEAQLIHHIDNHQLQNKPLFADICDALLEFVRGSQLIIHNAGFDLKFLNAEFERAQRPSFSEASGCEIIDTMDLAAELSPGMRRSLDALCDQYGVDRTGREAGHNAVLDAKLLAQVYLAMTGGQISMELDREVESLGRPQESYQQADSIVLYANPEELQLHEDFMHMMKAKTSADKLPSFG